MSVILRYVGPIVAAIGCYFNNINVVLAGGIMVLADVANNARDIADNLNKLRQQIKTRK